MQIPRYRKIRGQDETQTCTVSVFADHSLWGAGARKEPGFRVLLSRGQWVTLSWTVLTTADILHAASCPPGHGGGLPVGTGVGRGPQGKAGSVTAPSDTPGPMSLMWRTWAEMGWQTMHALHNPSGFRVSMRVAKKRPRTPAQTGPGHRMEQSHL